MFSISAIEAPIIIAPQNETEIQSTGPQNVLFQWAQPAGTAPGLSYTLRILELDRPDRNPQDAFNSTGYPVFFETEVVNTVYLYTIANPPLAKGKKYAFRVTAHESSVASRGAGTTFFQNGGNSEIYTFTYANSEAGPSGLEDSLASISNFILSLPYLSGTSQLTGSMHDSDIKKLQDQINADKNKRDTINITPENPLQFTWLWSSGDPKNPVLSTTDFNYELSFFRYSQNLSSGKRSLTKDNVSFFTVKLNDPDKNKLFTLKELQDAGFTFNNLYTFTLTAYNSSHKKISTITGRELFFMNVIPAKTRIVTGNLTYSFGNAGDTYPVIYTPVKISLSNAPGNFFYATTDRLGYFKFSVTGVMDTSSVFNLKIASPYYKQLSSGFKPAIGLDTIKLGNIIAEVFNYSATFQLMEKYKDYYVDSLKQYYVGSIDQSVQKPMPGLDAILYRKSKASQIPLVEGQLNNNGKFTTSLPKGFDQGTKIPIATAKTTVEINSKAEKITVVKFDHLICNMQNGDEYFVKVITNDSILANLETAEQEVTYSPNKNTNKGSFVIPHSGQTQTQQTHFQDNDTIFLISNQPPKSEITGRIYYRWPDDANRRPLANMKFEVRLEYDFQTDGEAVSDMPANKFTVSSNGQGIETFDNGMVVGTGQTDGSGNFTVTVINHNAKGVIGDGTMTPITIPSGNGGITTPGGLSAEDRLKNAIGGLKDVNGFIQSLNEVITNPKYENMLGDGSNTQQMINNNNLSGRDKAFGAGMGINTKALNGNALQNEMQSSGKVNGPNLDTEDSEILTDNDRQPITGPVRRVLRIRITGSNYFYSPNKDIVVQPYDKSDAGDFDAVVSEAKVAVKVEDKDTKTALTGIKVLIFRTTDDKDVPQGEGNQNGKRNKLLSPTYDQSASSGIIPAYMNKEFEWVSYDETNGSGEVTLSKLLANYKESLGNYTLEICSNPADNVYFYKAVFMDLKATVAVGYWNEEKFSKIDWGVNSFDLIPLPSRIAGRVLDGVSSKGIDKSFVSLNSENTGNQGNSNGSLYNSLYSNNLQMMFTDNDGYFEFLNAVGKDNMQYNLLISKSGYITKTDDGTIGKTGAQRVKDYNLTPDAIISGTVTSDENPSKVVPSFIRVDDGKIFETNDQGKFVIFASSGNNRKLFIIPKDVGYFNDTLTINIEKNFLTPLIQATAYRRQHRFRFEIADEQTNQLVKGAWVTFSHDKNLKSTTGSIPPYFVDFKFENVSVNAYSVKIEGPAGMDYIPQQINLVNNESKNFVYYTVKLKTGKKIKGVVNLNGVPVKNAFVYLDKSSIDQTTTDQLPEMSTRSDINGSFIIHGIPLSANNSVVVNATMDTTFTVIGAQATVTLKKESYVILNLKKFVKAKIDKFYNIPFSLEDLKPLNADSTRFTVTGMVHLDQCSSSFGWIDNNLASIRVRDVSMALKRINNQITPVTDADSVEMDATPSLKMRFAQKYNVGVTHKIASQSQTAVDNLILNKGSDGNGYVDGLVKLVDNSFNFPSTYISFDKVNGEFYFGNVSGKAIENNIRVMTMKNTKPIPRTLTQKFNISDSFGKAIEFKFLGFDAKADPFDSFISSTGDISLSVNVKCKLPNADPDTFSLKLEGLKLDNNSITPYTGSNTIKIFLEKWTLEINSWKIDVKEGGIVSSDGIVRTGTIDVPFSEFILRPDLFVFDKFDMSKLIIGGGLTLNVNPGIQPQLVYDHKIGADQSGHWKFALLGTDSNPVSVLTLPGLDKPLRINYVTLLSNQENMVGIFEDKFILKNVCYFKPDVFYAGKDAFILSGGIDLNGPRLSPIAANLKFNKPAGQPIQFGGFDPINFGFEGMGYVKFAAKNAIPILSDSKFQLDGIMTEPDKFNDINSTLTVLGPPDSAPDKRFKVEANDGFDLTLAEGAFNLKLKNALSKKKFNNQPFNGMMVSGNDWDNLQFTGELIETSSKPSTLSNAGKKTVLEFTVYGDIQAKSDEVEVSNLAPLPGLTLTYSKAEQRLIGNLTLVKQDFGGFSVSGAMEFSIGSPGWYMAAAGQVTGIPVINDFSAGVLLGMYSNLPDNVIKIATQFSKTVPCALNDSKSHFSGFFITGQKSTPLIPNVDIGFNAGVASFYLEVDMPTLDVSLYTSFQPFSVHMGLGIYAGINAGMSSITCTDISGSVNIIGRVSGEYAAGNFTVAGSVCGAIGVDVTQGIPTVVSGCIESTSIFNESIGLLINASLSNNGKSFGFTLGSGCPQTCF
jgi:hypothetical protein